MNDERGKIKAKSVKAQEKSLKNITVKNYFPIKWVTHKVGRSLGWKEKKIVVLWAYICRLTFNLPLLFMHLPFG